jgi:hypothetical protein
MKALVFSIVAACEFQPTPPPAPPPPPAPADVAPVATVATVGDAGEPVRPDAAPLMPVSDECLITATHIVEVMIADADTNLKNNFKKEQTTIVRGTAEACTAQAWSTAARTCYAQAKLFIDVKACEKKFPAPPEQPLSKNTKH